jgi:DNA-binding response OmpR family regulator
MPHRLPSVAAHPATNPVGLGRAVPSAHILLVDDDPAIRGTVALLLKDAGYRVGCAEDGEAGWHALCADRSDLLITDHEMPKLTGLELLRKVRAVSRRLPAIMISGRLPTSDADFESLLQPGAVLPKPFSFRVLLTKIEELLHVSRAGSTAESPEGWSFASRDSGDWHPSC